MLGKNRKLLLESFEYEKNKKRRTESCVTVEEGKRVLDSILYPFELSNYKYMVIMKVAMKEGMVYYRKLLDIYKNRFSGKGLFPRSYNI